MTKILTRRFSVKKIIRQGMTTRSELEFLAKHIGINNIAINWASDRLDDPSIPQILNIGNRSIGGTHWVALYKGKYFDPFGLSPVVPGVEWVPLQIQHIRSGHCGTYCLLWLYYMIHDEVDKFYLLFDDVMQASA